MSTTDPSQSSRPEDLFSDLFAQVFGIEKLPQLVPEYPVQDIYGGSRAIDFALRTPDDKVAIEIDGGVFHDPERIPFAKFEDDLLRQNSLVHQGWRVFRWTDRQLAHEPDLVKEQLALFLESIPGLLSFDDFLPRQRGAVLELRPHQDEALAALQALRDDGRTIALLTHAQGAGKTVTAITDAHRLGGRTLFLAHTRDLVTQAHEHFQRLWPEAPAGLFFGGRREPDAFNVVGSVQSVADNLPAFAPAAFAYLILDEAHHATAPVYRRVLAYFRPRFLLGLTATPDRADGQSALDVFRDCAHRLSLREAVELGELVPIRCVRVKTNVDLGRVRFNQVQYHRKDIEETVAIPARDRLIVQTYLDHVASRKAVAFCVNVRYGEDLAALFRAAGVPARSVSGRLPGKEREAILHDYRQGDLRVLCACDILNEGWDCPDVEVLLMARPTLSRVIYLQQLGRGTRLAPGKEYLTVFDFVDNASRYNCALSLHRVLGETTYRPGGLVLAPQAQHDAEAAALAAGAAPTTVLPISLWVRAFEQIDVFNWQEAVTGMLTADDLEVELACTEGLVRRAVERGQVQPDHQLTLGERTYSYFRKERVEEVRAALGLPRVDDQTIQALFTAFVTQMDMSASYKPVLLLSLLDTVDEHGKARLDDVVAAFRRFYETRRAAGLVVERPAARLARVADLDDAQVRTVMLEMPFKKFEQRRYLKYDRDLAYVRFAPALWRQLKPADRDALRRLCEQSIEAYYDRLPLPRLPILLPAARPGAGRQRPRPGDPGRLPSLPGPHPGDRPPPRRGLLRPLPRGVVRPVRPSARHEVPPGHGPPPGRLQRRRQRRPRRWPDDPARPPPPDPPLPRRRPRPHRRHPRHPPRPGPLPTRPLRPRTARRHGSLLDPAHSVQNPCHDVPCAPGMTPMKSFAEFGSVLLAALQQERFDLQGLQDASEASCPLESNTFSGSTSGTPTGRKSPVSERRPLGPRERNSSFPICASRSSTTG